jgi:hypothetical protein
MPHASKKSGLLIEDLRQNRGVTGEPVTALYSRCVMARRRVIKSVLHNFLGTYMSRYSDYRGYWLFGFLVRDLFHSEFDLLDRGNGDTETPLAVAQKLAATRFGDQLHKAGLDLSKVQQAQLTISSSRDATKASVHGHPGPVFNLSFRACAVMDDSRRYECQQVAFVASHDPLVELRSAREG